jgi:peptide-methionine (S)-S-oxide reductase
MDSTNLETATLAGGCFWCTEAVFKRLKGVESAVSGYCGGQMDKPNYEQVASGQSGHAEAIQIKFDPKIISFEHLLDIFWATHDPTTLNKQGADEGTQYRSSIFYHNEEQKGVAEKSKAKMEASGQLYNKIVTEIVPFEKFYTAEEYHQDFYDTFKGANSYCSIVIDPKVKKLLDQFNDDVKEEYLHG